MSTNPTHDDPGVYRTLLESTNAIPWKIDWDTMRFAYIGPQIEALLGWSQSSWLTVTDWADRIHEEDRKKTVDFCVAQSQQGIDHEADYRALTPDGDYVWIRDVVHVKRRPDGSVDCLVGFMFDISDRKRAEGKIRQLQKELETLACRDALTGIGNRSMFDQVLAVEWGKACAVGEPLSMIMLDLDFFSEYTGSYGQPQGELCLQKVARLLDDTASRTRDLCARLGGEQFAILMPGTSHEAALGVAARFKRMLVRDAIAHRSSPVADILTCSMGVGTIMPGKHERREAFVDLVATRLERARTDGRNRIVGSGD
jgi:diguanylate cyclase (GGDEF)-like protein/PAS domain S-box-containing protein